MNESFVVGLLMAAHALDKKNLIVQHVWGQKGARPYFQMTLHETITT